MTKANGLFVDLKFIIAERLNKNPKYCWANLVTWAENWDEQPWYQPLTRSGREHLQDQTCTETGGGAWCGKCRVNGRLSH